MESQRVGLVTLYRNNYGSTLQCYSLKRIIEEQGYTCELLDEKVNTSLKNKILKKMGILEKSILYPGYLKEFLSMRRAMKIEQTYMSPVSLNMLQKFIDSILKPHEYAWDGLLKLGSNDLYKTFIVGSDQVWNASRKISSFFFLEFAPQQKRHTYAVSFGISSLPKWYKREVINGLKKFDTISVREKAGRKIIEENGDNLVKQHIDPTMLLKADDWREFVNGIQTPSVPFILVHFLNEPSDLALNEMRLLSQKYNCCVKGFGYWYKQYDGISNLEFVNGGPKEYVALIDSATYVLTDSFHTTIFSINLHKNFFVFHRNYLHGFPQTSRIYELLDKFNLKNRLLTSIESQPLDCVYDNEVDEIICTERKLALDYIKEQLER